MSKVNSNDKNYYSIIMKSIQNEIKDFIIDKYLSIIMNQNIKLKELKIKSENFEKLANKCLKKLLSYKEKKTLKKIQNSKEKKTDLNSSNDCNFSNSSQYFSARDATLQSDLDSTNLTSNFSPKVSTIECKKITFKKKDNNIEKNEKLKKKTNYNNYYSNNFIQKNYINHLNNYKNQELNSPFLKKKKNSIIGYYYDFDNNIKRVQKNSSIQIDTNNTEVNLRKPNNIKDYNKLRESPKSVKKIYNNDNSIITTPNENLTKNKKFSLNNKIINSSSSKNCLCNNSIIGQKIRHIKTLSDIGNAPFKNNKNLKKNSIHIHKNTSDNGLSKSPESTRSNLNNEFKSSIVKITLAPENISNIECLKKNIFN
jgi:hypothetical protein